MATAPVVLGPMRRSDWPAVAAIYRQGIETGNATFETEPPSWEAWDASHLEAGRLVARVGDAMAGWAALSPVSDRCAYAGVAEVSVYVAADHRGRGVGARLLAGLVEASEEAGIWTLQAGMFPENEGSLALHRKAGFRVVGRRERLGKLDGRWRDVVLLERRSGAAGSEADRPRPAAEHAGIGRSWDAVAREKYRREVDAHVELLRGGGHDLLEPESEMLAGLLEGARVVQLQCSHGLDALGLLNAGAASVAGVDLSGEMIAQAREKAERAGLADRAAFHHADAADPPAELEGTADLVYTGRGSLPWIVELEPWAAAVRRLLRPGGHVFVHEGHPLTFLWDREADHLRLREDGDYFDDRPRERSGFPATAAARALGEDRPAMPERGWRPGQVVEALVGAGLELRRFREHPHLFWDQFPRWPEGLRGRLPNSYSILARR